MSSLQGKFRIREGIPPEIRILVYITNLIESLNRMIKKVIKNKLRKYSDTAAYFPEEMVIIRQASVVVRIPHLPARRSAVNAPAL